MSNTRDPDKCEELLSTGDCQNRSSPPGGSVTESITPHSTYSPSVSVPSPLVSVPSNMKPVAKTATWPATGAVTVTDRMFVVDCAVTSKMVGLTTVNGCTASNVVMFDMFVAMSEAWL